MNIINLTPHKITFMRDETITIPMSGMIARVAVKREQVGVLNGLPICRSVFGEVKDLPEPKPDTVYIVSALVAQAVKGKRNDIYIVDDTVRDESGNIIGCRGLGVI